MSAFVSKASSSRILIFLYRLPARLLSLVCEQKQGMRITLIKYAVKRRVLASALWARISYFSSVELYFEMIDRIISRR